MKETVWLFGDSYAALLAEDRDFGFTRWFQRLEEDYNVINFATGGTGPEWSLQRLIEEDGKIEEHDKEKISIIFLASSTFRFNFSFYAEPYLQVFAEYTEMQGMKEHKYIQKKYGKFIKTFMKDYIFPNGGRKDSEQLILSNMFMVKHYTRNYKKCMYAPIFYHDKIDSKTAQLYSSENFYIYTHTSYEFTIFESYGEMKVPNHMGEEGHQKVYELVTAFLLD